MASGRIIVRWHLVLVVALSWLILGGISAVASTPTEQEGLGASEVERLREVVEQQAAEIARLRAQLADLVQRMETAGDAVPNVEEGNGSGTDAARLARPSRKVMFILESSQAMQWHQRPSQELVLSSIDQLEVGQTFNILLHNRAGVTAMQPGLFLSPTPENRRRAETFVKAGVSGEPRLIDAALFSLRSRPDVIWVIGTGRVDNYEAALKTIREANAGRSRINTTVQFSDARQPERRHFLWTLAQENGGTCVGADGEAIDEPVVPVTVVAPPPPPPRRPAGLPLD